MSQLFMNRETGEIKPLKKWGETFGQYDERKMVDALYDGSYGDKNSPDALEEVFCRYEVDEVIYHQAADGTYAYSVVDHYPNEESICLDTYDEVKAYLEEKQFDLSPGTGYEVFYMVCDAYGELMKTYFVMEINYERPSIKKVQEIG